MPSSVPGFVAAVVLSLHALPLAAQEAQTWASAWGRADGRLVVDLPYGELNIVGHDVDSVRISLRSLREGPHSLPSPTLADGVVRLQAPRNQLPLELTIHLPRRFDLDLRSANGSEIHVDGVHGAVAVENSNAGVFLSGLRGPVLAATSNGPIQASFGRLPDEGPLSFITSNNSITITVPRASEMDLFLETDNGRIESDFEVLPITEVREIPQAGTPNLRGRSRVGAGGVLVRARTENGVIAIRAGGAQI